MLINTKGVWKKYFVDNFINTNFKIIDVINDTDGLFIRLKFESLKPDIRVSFSEGVVAYTVTPTKFLMESLGVIQKKYGADFFEIPFFVIYDSDYLKWIYEESYGFFNENEPDDIKLKHYVIIGTNLVFEVLTNDTPCISSNWSFNHI